MYILHTMIKSNISILALIDTSGIPYFALVVQHDLAVENVTLHDSGHYMYVCTVVI